MKFFTRKGRSTRARMALYERSLAAARAVDPGAKFPCCNICGQPIMIGEAWHESHVPSPHALTGADADGIAHAACNLARARGEAALVAKVKRVHARHIGAHCPRNPLPFGRADPRKRTLSGAIVDRRTGEPWRNFPAAEPEGDVIGYARLVLCVAALFAWCAIGEALLP